MYQLKNIWWLLVLSAALGLGGCQGGGGEGERRANGEPTASPGNELPADDSDEEEDPDDPPPPPPPPPEDDPDLGVLTPRTRYSLANACFAIQSVRTGKYLVADGDTYEASASSPETGEAFFFKPSALGSYLIYNRNRELLHAADSVDNVALADASDEVLWTVTGASDTTTYPSLPGLHVEPTAQQVADYRDFAEPAEDEFTEFQLLNQSTGLLLAGGGDGQISAAAAPDALERQFRFDALSTGCAPFPEAQSNVEGETFSGTTADGRVLGMADVHVHISATEFLGKAQWGWPIHPYGVTHALGDCDAYHGEMGSQDAVGAFLGNDQDGHATDGWPTFSEWPARDALTHEAIYWKWLERSWKAGLRIAVNDVVDNETLCELQRNAAQDPTLDCNPMNSAAAQVGTMFLMQDYIDAQYGGRGEGWFRIVLTADEARSVIEQGKLAVILGIEISNLLGCQVIYNNPNRSLEPFEETGAGGAEASYTCAMTETGADNEILTQLNRLWNLGIRQVISIHEFDNAFGGNGIFMAFLNLGNRENSGGIPGGALTYSPGSLEFPTVPEESASGEFWTTYDCPLEEAGGDYAYLWGSSGGEPGAKLRSFGQNNDQNDPTANCPPMGQGGRYGGPSNCYPNANQCNARWMTPIGLYLYKKLMEFGFIFDFDHMELAMKDQAMDLTEAQPIAYPVVSTHGTFGGTSIDQAQRVLRNGGVLYPSIGRSTSFINDMNETLGVYEDAMNRAPAIAEADRPLFGFGFGTDTNGLSGQSPPRQTINSDNEVTYPFTLFSGPGFDELEDFDNVTGLLFDQPGVMDADGVIQRQWHVDRDGNAHHGMLADTVREIAIEGSPEHLQHLYNSAESYLQMWKRTEAARDAIVGPDGTGKAAGDPAVILRRAPTP